MLYFYRLRMDVGVLKIDGFESKRCPMSNILLCIPLVIIGCILFQQEWAGSQIADKNEKTLKMHGKVTIDRVPTIIFGDSFVSQQDSSFHDTMVIVGFLFYRSSLYHVFLGPFHSIDDLSRHDNYDKPPDSRF